MEEYSVSRIIKTFLIIPQLLEKKVDGGSAFLHILIYFFPLQLSINSTA